MRTSSTIFSVANSGGGDRGDWLAPLKPMKITVLFLPVEMLLC